MPAAHPPDADPLSPDETRLLAVIAQRLDRRPPRPRSRAAAKARLLETIEHLGCVQLDTISVVARSHETVLWSRLGPYDPDLLAELHDPDGALFEYWLHAAAIGPIALFPYLRRAMAAYRARHEAMGSWAAGNGDVLDRVRVAVAERGPTASRHFARVEGPRANPWDWWGGKPDRRALDHLWSCGELMVRRRDGFQRVYDLAERVLPGGHAAPLPTEAEQRRALVGRALGALGVATPRWAADYFRTGARPHVPPALAARELAALAAEGLARPVVLPGLPDPAWIDAALLPRLASLRGDPAVSVTAAPLDGVGAVAGFAADPMAGPSPGSGPGPNPDTARLAPRPRVPDPRRPTLTTLLSPFDNLVWHRGRTLALFGFDYRLESYTPALARRYGYYTLPILHRGRLVGRLDPVLDRRARVLTVKIVHLETGVRPTSHLAAALAAALRDYAAFVGAAEVRALAADPPALLPLLAAALGGSSADAALG